MPEHDETDEVQAEKIKVKVFISEHNSLSLYKDTHYECISFKS